MTSNIFYRSHRFHRNYLYGYSDDYYNHQGLNYHNCNQVVKLEIVEPPSYSFRFQGV